MTVVQAAENYVDEWGLAWYLGWGIYMHQFQPETSQNSLAVTSCFEFDRMSVETETTWSEFPNDGKAMLEQILVSEEVNKSKRAILWESHSGIQVGKLPIWLRSFEIEKL